MSLSFLQQVRFKARLKALTDLHVGTGDTEKLKMLRQNTSNTHDGDPDVALVARDVNGALAIPATAIKGAVRKSLDPLGDDQLGDLLGQIKTTDTYRVDGEEERKDAGRMGAVWLHNARWSNSPPIPAATNDPVGPQPPPFWDAGAGSFIATHVAIDRKSGAAARGKLFYVEQVPAGTEFEISGVVLASRQVAETNLQTVFAPLAAKAGLAVGAEQRMGAGRLRVDGPIKCDGLTFDGQSGSIKRSTFQVSIAPSTVPARGTKIKLDLHCLGPYLTIDPARRVEGGNILPARRLDMMPVLPSSSLMGVLRWRAAWLAITDASGDSDDPMRVLERDESPVVLTRTERLFGVTGWRGLLAVDSIEVTSGTLEQPYTSVAIDRFSGATLDSALYSTEIFTGTKVSVTLVLEERSARDGKWPASDDRALLETLLLDVAAEGLMLGHGTQRGYGWFDVEVWLDGKPIKTKRTTSGSAPVPPSAAVPVTPTSRSGQTLNLGEKKKSGGPAKATGKQKGKKK